MSGGIQFLSGQSRDFALPQLRHNLWLLGWPRSSDGTGLLADPALFIHPQPVAFQEIMHFLMGVLLGTDTQRKQFFHEIWPILEKKQEAEFRKKVFQYYKQLQLQHKDDLPMVNVSLLQTPGGPKFINFMHQFSQFVLKTEILRVKAKLEDSSPLLKCSSTSQGLIRRRIADNIKSISAIDADLRSYEASLQRDMTHCVDEYRTLKARTRELESQIGQFHDDELEQKCQDFLEKSNELTAQTDSYMTRIQSDLKVVQDIIVKGNNARLKLDLGQVARKGDGIPEVFDRIFAAAEHSKHQIQPMSFDLETIQVRNHQIHQERRMFQGRKSQLEHELLPKIKDQIRVLEGQIAPKRHPITLTQRPQIRLDFSAPCQKSLHTSLDLTPTKHEPSNLGNSVEISQTLKRVSGGPKRIPNFYQPSMMSESSFQDDEAHHPVANQPFYPRSQLSSTSSHHNCTTRGDMSQTRVCSIEESKMSVFSPILSSSRMEPNSPRSTFKVISPRQPGGSTLEQSKIAHYRSVLNATRASASERIPESPQEIEKKDLGLPTSFEPIRLSPTLWEESPRGSSEAKVRPRSFDLEDQTIATRLDDLMNTLALDSSNLLDEDSVNEMPSIHVNL
ncbi:hypothetical protein TCAL_08849 [Tigriopus californicus]|uniref:HAUS augmin-like complex subunit 6 N-terminal domain-containing protein n=1 Tax=Tigriopus californicus TaxID=6832 RepID=A0A553PS49_TIGCA|nr:HAUS augmin-like complex subunit 6 [Tigriopus californicus]TRY80495.1 hypothetical protein TCAL_08849 [Tigriopus californicus]|eukprot:TCALIF_08849-PA protein Name:"Similar to HAUS6 HAUS augmin-like complex subunit 6 (Homo sapiens)" AED:0.00 eAED:0.00 QI:113/1/1/1/1/1/3/72/617